METEVRRARHDLRGRFNALKLCIDALETFDSKDDQIEFLTLIIEAADRTNLALDELESILDHDQ